MSPGYDTHTLIHRENQVSQDREATILELIRQKNAGRSTTFNKKFLNHLQEHPELSLADAWDVVENHFASQQGVRPRQNPYR